MKFEVFKIFTDTVPHYVMARKVVIKVGVLCGIIGHNPRFSVFDVVFVKIGIMYFLLGCLSPGSERGQLTYPKEELCVCEHNRDVLGFQDRCI